jgi:eukaryotic-like serine/threonine-protein kinase
MEASRLVADITTALSFLHSAGYVHRDIKRSNVRFSGDSAVLIDFDLAAQWHEGDPPLTQQVGTRGWMAPEVTAGAGYMLLGNGDREGK